uniref:TauD/TfdA-like domain-containing protein n=1 Tax=Odontella aurita TaxID=265563 RepID=A0A7S4JV88_9STRA
MYGAVWSTSSSNAAPGTSTADSAYGSGALPLHTDMTYLRDPPGVQIFAMGRPSKHGGASVFGDGLAASESLRRDHPDAFDVLCRTVRRYRCVDDDGGWHLEAEGPVIRAADRGGGAPFPPHRSHRHRHHHRRWGPVGMIRHNDLDRLPDLPPADVRSIVDEREREMRIAEFYSDLDHAHELWDGLLGSDDIRLRMDLRPGDMVAVANQRCFHGRESFTADADSPRSVMGCYVSQDELNSRFRRAGYRVF